MKSGPLTHPSEVQLHFKDFKVSPFKSMGFHFQTKKGAGSSAEHFGVSLPDTPMSQQAAQLTEG